MKNALLNQLQISLKLHARNKMALVYSYLFPTIFLVAFWVLYRFEQVPLVRHVGELLTVTALIVLALTIFNLTQIGLLYSSQSQLSRRAHVVGAERR